MNMTREQKQLLVEYMENRCFPALENSNELKEGDIVFLDNQIAGVISKDKQILRKNGKEKYDIGTANRPYAVRVGDSSERLSMIHVVYYKGEKLHSGDYSVFPCLVCATSCKVMGGKKECPDCFFCNKIAERSTKAVARKMLNPLLYDIEIPLLEAPEYLQIGDFIQYTAPQQDMTARGYITGKDSSAVRIQGRNCNVNWWAWGGALDELSDGAFIKILDTGVYFEYIWNKGLLPTNNQ